MNATQDEPKADSRTKVAIACQGGGMHASFEVGVLTAILEDLKENNRFDLVGLSGTSAGALTTLMAWYGLATKNGQEGSPDEAINQLNRFWDGFTAITTSEKALNAVTSLVLAAQDRETLGLAPRALLLNPASALSLAVNAALPRLGVRRRYFDFAEMLNAACPDFDRIDWTHKEQTRLMVGATEIKHGIETVFDSDVNWEDENRARDGYQPRHMEPFHLNPWRTRLPLSLEGVAASGTLPTLRRAEVIGEGVYWDGLYSQNPPVREFFFNTVIGRQPNEIWIVRINPQQCARLPTSIADIEDRQNELSGNLSLDKELDAILTVNDWLDEKLGGNLATALEPHFKRVTLRTIRMTDETAAKLRCASKFDRSRGFVQRLRSEGYDVASAFLADWPNRAGSYPGDAGDPLPPKSISGDPFRRRSNERGIPGRTDDRV